MTTHNQGVGRALRRAAKGGRGGEERKVVFVPYYFYLQYESFRRIMIELRREGISSELLYMRSSPLDERSSFGVHRFEEDGLPFREVGIARWGLRGSNAVAFASRVPQLLANRGRIARYLRQTRPALVVLGSDLGGIYIRLLQDECERLAIPILVVQISYVGPDNGMRMQVPAPARRLLRRLGLERALLFHGTVLGGYSPRSVVTVSSDQERSALEKHGVPKDRIVVTGNPSYDPLFACRSIAVQSAQEQVLRHIGVGRPIRLVTYFTEMIQELYGMDYVDGLHANLAKLATELPQDCHFLVRPHPREAEVMLAQLAKHFSGPRQHICTAAPIIPLIRSSTVVIGHFSNILSEALFAGIPVLRLNPQGDRRHSVLHLPAGILEASSERELGSKVKNYLGDEAFRNEVQSTCEEWVRLHAGEFDGRSALRVARLIHDIITDSAAGGTAWTYASSARRLH